MYRFWLFFSIMALCALTGSGVSADPDFSVVQTHDLGTVDWSLRLVSAQGSSIPLEQSSPSDLNKQERLDEMAKNKATENLMATILSVPLDSEHLASSLIFSNNGIMEQIRAMINQSRITKKDYLTDGSVEIVMELSFDGGFAQLLLPEEIQQIQPLKTVTRTPSDKELVPKNTRPDPEDPPPFTGLIVDTRGLTIRPALSPRVIDESGEEVYGPAFISREHAVQHGTVFYSRSIKDPAIVDRTGPNPLIVTGLKSSGTLQADVIISRADAAKLHSNSAHLNFLNRCMVVILIDLPPKQK